MVKTGTSSSHSPQSPVPDRNENHHHHQPKYTGVRKRKWGKWVSEIRLPNSRERIWLGSYDSPEKAARAFDAALYCLRGPNARFNFRDNPPEIVGGQSLTPTEIQAVAARYANDNPTPTTAEETNAINSEQNDMSSVEGQVDSALDWSFLNMLDCNNEHEYGYYTVMENMSDGYYPPPPSPPPAAFDDDQNGDDSSYSHQSFLWNF